MIRWGSERGWRHPCGDHGKTRANPCIAAIAIAMTVLSACQEESAGKTAPREPDLETSRPYDTPTPAAVLPDAGSLTGMTSADAGTNDVAPAADAGAPEDGLLVSSVDLAIQPDPQAAPTGMTGGDPEEPTAQPIEPLLLIAVAPQAPTAMVGGMVTFTATLMGSDGTRRAIGNKVVWQSSAPEVASIDSRGVATALALGSTRISARLGSLMGVEVLTVAPAGVEGVYIAPSSASIGVGDTQQFRATVHFANGQILDVTNAVVWTSSRPEIALVDLFPTTWGLATAFTPGQTEIGFRIFGASAQATLTVIEQ
jgi:hypothetical protein